jgi:Putative Ig domain
MSLFQAWRLLAKSSNGVAGSSRGRRKPGSGRKKSAGQHHANLGSLIDTLEDRLLLSATASPTFRLSGHWSSSSLAPAVTPASVAPINPTQMRAAYGVNQVMFGGTAGTGAGQTIAIVDAYNDPKIVADASTFNTQFGLQQFNVSGGPTFQVLNETGGSSLPSNSTAGGWDVEESLDVEWAHSIAPQANIILFEANSASYGDLMTAVQTAAHYAGVSAVSMSWGGGEFSGETSYDSEFLTPSGHQGVTFLASTGDDGTPAGYPALSPNVVAVGGTSLNIDSSGDYLGESAWSDGGGGISQDESQPSYQSGKVNGTSSTKRTVPDVSMDADPNTGVYVLDSFAGGWYQVGGTSLSSPMWAGLIAVANQGRVLNGQGTLNGLTQTLPMLYNLPSSDFHDVTTGSNGTYSATTGYDLTTGLGTPIANLLVPALAGYSSTQAPSVSGPSSGSVNENSSLTFSSGQGNAISLTDNQAGSNADSLTLSVGDGTLSLGSTTGLTFGSGTNNSASMVVTGTLANLNAALSGLVYTPNSGFSGGDSLQVTVNDTGDGLSGSKTVALTVNAPTAPTVTVPSAQQVNENTSLVFSSAHGTAISFGDSFAGSNSETLSLSVSSGGLTFGSTAGLSFTGGANGGSSMTVTGTLANLNADISGLTYTPTSGFSGSDSLQVSLTDSSDSLTGSASVGLTIRQAPAVTAPASVSVKKNGSITLSGANAISVTDAAAGIGAEQLTLQASHGTLKFSSLTGLKVVGGANKSASMIVSGTLANLNHDLAGLVYTPKSNYTGSDAIMATAADTSDGLASPTASISVTVGTAPAFVSAKKASFTVGSTGSFSLQTSGFPAPSFAVAGGLPSGVSLNPSTGVLSGTPNQGAGGTYHLTFTAANGFGNQASQAFTLTINQQPAVAVPNAFSINQGVPVVFSAANSNAVTVTDVNAGTAADRLTLSAANGTIKLGTTSGLHVIAGANKSSSMTISGTVAHLNAALNGLIFTPAAGFVGNASLGFSLLNTGNGLSGGGSVGLTFNAVTGSAARVAGETSSTGSNWEWAGFTAAVDELYQ